MVYLTQDWDTFDTWCCLRGIDADTLTSRRLVALTLAHLTEGAERDRVEAFLADLERTGNNILHPSSPEAAPIPEVAPPPGWKSDAENWAGIQGFLGQAGTIKKAVSRG